ncbi:hsp70 family protein [Gigaspora margarita]|uniref:Hsp70 family protein n=1 Tax=Gigaspora margarita TaxID=4874 RepID=A0A8H3WXC0_GIGMA|nr:hsp70 family protein [Gigaspora margarita]
MESISNILKNIFNPIEPLEEIYIKINDKVPVVYDKLGEKFTLDNTLNDVRNQLSDEDEIIRIQDNMNFCSPSGIILRDSESNKLLKDVLFKDNILKIIKLSNINKNVILEKCKLKYGINMTDEGPKIANTIALDFSQDTNIIMEELSIFTEKTDNKTYENSFEDFLGKNLIADIKASIEFLHSSIGFGVSHEYSSTDTNNTKFSSTHEIMLLPKYIFEIGNVKPTEEFKTEVELALNSDRPIEKFKNICEKYGEFIAHKVKIGGKVQTISYSNASNLKLDKLKNWSANGKLGSEIVGGVNFGYSMNQGINEYSSISSVKTYTRVYGGDKSNFRQNNIDSWRDSLNDYESWCAIEYDDLVHIFDLLDPELRHKVIKKTYNEKILYSTKDSVEFTMLPHDYSYCHKLKIPSDLMLNLKEYKIFASQGDKISTRVIYTSDSSAIVVLHRISESKRKQSKSFNLQIGWIIVGHPKSFKYECHDWHITHSCEEYVKNWEKKSISIYQFDEIRNHSLLATCAQRIPQQSEIIPIKSKLATGVHFCYESQQLKACYFIYDLESMKCFKQNNHPELSDLIIHCSIVRQNSSINNLQLDKKIRLSFHRKPYILYNISEHNIPLWTHDRLTFVNILQNANACPNNCNAGFIILSPNPKYLEFSQNNLKDLKDLEISYFCLAPLIKSYIQN